MNKRIQLLAEQAGLEWGPGGYADYSDFDHLLFSQLIVWECVEVCNSRAGNSDYNTGRMHCASDLKEHFGIGMGIKDKKQLIRDLLGVSNDTKS
jgi:hypothetical protein